MSYDFCALRPLYVRDSRSKGTADDMIHRRICQESYYGRLMSHLGAIGKDSCAEGSPILCTEVVHKLIPAAQQCSAVRLMYHCAALLRSIFVSDLQV